MSLNPYCKHISRFYMEIGNLSLQGKPVMSKITNPIEEIKLLQMIALQRGGKCLSTQWESSTTKMRWQCHAGHIWEAVSTKIKQGRWCPTCNQPKRGTTEEMHQIAAKHNGRLLSDKYVNAKTKLEWQCTHGHTWHASPDKVKRGTWCPTCNKPTKLTIEEMHKIASFRGGRCLSTRYINTDTKLIWRCACGYEWQATPYKVKKGTWCPKCAGTLRKTLNEAQVLAKQKGGECLSTEYVNKTSQLLWRCQHGHEWSAPLRSIENGTWCSVCKQGEHLQFNAVVALIESKGGRCFSTSMKNPSEKLKVECAYGHVWYPTAHTLVKGHWCRVCARQASINLSQLRSLANERGGKCLSATYKNNLTPMDWECSISHHWKAVAASILAGSWCPYCSAGLGERITKAHFEQIFGETFVKYRPDWLVNDRGNKMELDGYAEKIGVAFEYEGEQHYSLKTHFIKTTEALSQRKLDDIDKARLCKEQGIKLIQVPDIFSRLPLNDIQSFIIGECEKLGITLTPEQKACKIDLSPAYKAKNLLYKSLQEICADKGGKVISPHYINATTKLTFECQKGHQWQTTPFQINSGAWCHECGAKKASDSRRTSLESLQAIATKNGGLLLSRSYDHCKQKLLWQCGKGHKWEATLATINKGRWCPTCNCRNNTLEAIYDKVTSQGGQLIECKSSHPQASITLKCLVGHTWTTKVRYIRDGMWCPKCSSLRLAEQLSNGIDKARELANAKGGVIISERYVGGSKKMRWRCAAGHNFEASFAVAKRQWCKHCAKLERSNKALKQCHQYAIKHGGECLSKQYLAAKVKLTWKCRLGHLFEATPDNVKQGKWCPACKGTRISDTKRRNTQKNK